MLEGNASATLADEITEWGAFGFAQSAFKLEIEFEALHSQNMSQEMLCIEPRRFDSLLVEERRRTLQDLQQRHGFHAIRLRYFQQWKGCLLRDALVYRWPQWWR